MKNKGLTLIETLKYDLVDQPSSTTGLKGYKVQGSNVVINNLSGGKALGR